MSDESAAGDTLFDSGEGPGETGRYREGPREGSPRRYPLKTPTPHRLDPPPPLPLQVHLCLGGSTRGLTYVDHEGNDLVEGHGLGYGIQRVHPREYSGSVGVLTRKTKSSMSTAYPSLQPIFTGTLVVHHLPSSPSSRVLRTQETPVSQSPFPTRPSPTLSNGRTIGSLQSLNPKTTIEVYSNGCFSPSSLTSFCR